MESETPVAPADRVGLGMELRLDAASHQLLLPARLLFGWLLLEGLELRVPSTRMAAANGKSLRAIDYQRVRTEVRAARLSMRQEHIDAYVAGCGPQLAALGVDELTLRSCDGYLGLSARVRESALVADLSARLYLNFNRDQLRISCGHPRVYGHLDTPAPILAHRLMLAIFQAGESTYASVLGLGDFGVRPLHAALLRALPAAGWRLPKQADLRIVSAKLDSGGASVGFEDESNHVESSAGQAAATLAESLDRFRAADALLQGGDVEGAMRGYRGELAARGPEQPFLVERILSIASASRNYFSDGLELARQVLGRWPDFAPAHAAIASIAVAQGDVETGAARYRSLSLASATVGDDEGTVRAALAGARLLRQFAADDSTQLYELVLEHRPGHAESAEALTDRYRDEKRWSDLVRLIRMRLATTEAAERQARDHARLAEVLANELGDPESALAELVIASRLEIGIPGVHEQRAEVEFLLGDSDSALASLEAANALHKQRNDTRAQLRNLVRGGKACLEAERFETAENWFLAALDISVSDSSAMRGAAQAAAGLGRHENAARRWRELFDAGIEAPTIQAHFACELGRSLLAAGGSNEARVPLERATETGGPRTRAEAHALLAEIRNARGDTEESLVHLQEAVIELTSSEPDEAFLYADSPADRRQRSASLSLTRAILALAQGEPDEAVDDLRRAFVNARPGDELRKSAARHLLQHTPSNAGELGWLDELAAGNADADESAYLSIRRAAILDAAGDRSAALAALAAALDNDDTSDAPRRAALLLKAEFLEAMGQSKARADVLAQRAALSGSNAQRARASVESAEGWLAASDRERSEAAVREALQTLAGADDENSISLRRRALLCLGECAYGGRAWQRLDEAYSELYESRMTEASTEHLLRWGTALEKLGRAEQAAETLEIIVGANQGDAVAAQASRLLGHLYEGLGQYQRAGAAQERYASSPVSELSDPARADAWFRAGSIYRRDADLVEDAKRCMATALSIARAHLPALDALEQIARDQEDHERLAVILGRKVAAMGRHPHRQRGLLIRLAALQEHVLGRMDVARETYRRVLEMAPEYRPALRFAARDARKSGNLSFACEALGKLAGDLPDDGELPLSAEELATHQQDSLLSLASLIESTAGQAQASTVALLLDKVREQDDDRLWRALESVYRRRQDLVGLADVLGQRAPHQTDALALKGALERIDILVNQLSDHGGALIALGIAQKRHPQSPELARWRRSLEAPTEPPEASQISRSQASPKEVSNPNVVAALAQELLDTGEWAKALALLSSYTSSEQEPELLWLHVEAALGLGQVERAAALLPKLAQEARSRHDSKAEHRAIRRLADLAIESEDSQHNALELYGRALELDPNDLIAAEIYAELLQGSAPPEQALAAREEVLEIARRTDAGPLQEALALRPLAQKAFEAGDLAQSIALFEKAIALAPDMLGLYRECADVAAAGGDVHKAVRWLETLADRQAAGDSDPSYHGESLGDLFLLIAELYYNQLLEPDKARRCMRRAADSFGSGVRRNATLRQLASESDGAGSVEESIEAYEAIGLEQLSAHERLLCAKLYQRLARDHAAVEILESARLAGTLSNEGRSLLFALHRQRARNEELAESLEAGAQNAPGGIAITRLREARRIYDEVLANENASRRVVDALRVMGVTTEDAIRSATISELERAAEAAGAGDDSSVAASLLGRAIHNHCRALASVGESVDALVLHQLAKLRSLVTRPTLASHRSSTREVDALVSALLAAAAVQEDQKEAATYLIEVASLRRYQLHDTRAAADALAQALSMRADDTKILAELTSILREAGDYTQLASAYELHLSVITGPRRAPPLLDLGRLCQHIFREDERARRCYREALELDNSLSTEVEELLASLGGAASLGDGNVQEISHELDKAAALEALGKPDEARRVYELAAMQAPGDSRAFLALRRIYGECGENERLLRVLEQLTTLSTSRKERAQLFFERATLARNIFHDDVLVYEYLKEAAANDPDELRYSHALRSIAMARGEWALAAELTYREIASAEGDHERGALYHELALIFDEKLLDASQAVVNYEQALVLDPTIPAAPRPLARLYELAGRHTEASSMYQQAADMSPDPIESARLFRHAAMNAEQAGLFEDARELYAKVGQASEGHDSEAARLAIERLADDAPLPDSDGEHEPATVDAMEARLREIEDPKERAVVFFELGSAYQHDLEDLNAALGAYERALECDPLHLQAIDALADICYQQRDWSRAQRLYQQVPAEKSALPPAIVSLRQAEIAESLGLEEQAFVAFRTAFEFAPSDTKVLAGLSRSATRVGHQQEAMKAQQALVRLIPVDQIERLRQARLGLGKLAEDIGDNQSAIETYELMLRDEPDSIQALRILPRLYHQAGRVSDATSSLQSLVHVTPLPADRARLLYELGEMYGTDSELAADAFLKAIDLDPSHVPTLRRLLHYYCQNGDVQAACEMARDLEKQSCLLEAETGLALLYRAAVAAALTGNARLCTTIGQSLGLGAPKEVAQALRESFEAQAMGVQHDWIGAARALCAATGDSLSSVVTLLEASTGERVEELVKKLTDSPIP